MAPPARRPTLAAAVVVLSCLAALAVAEGVVRLLEARRLVGRQKYEEAYQARAFKKELGEAGYLAKGFRGQVSDEYGRPVEWVHNSAGFRSRREFAREPPPGTLRILIVGDSFVAGHRVGQDDTFGAQLETWLRESGRYQDVEVLLAAVEEPATGLYYLERWGLAWKPHLVIVGLTLGNDIAQVYFNLGPNGMYRFPDQEGGPVLDLNPEADHEAQAHLVEQPLLPQGCWVPGRGSEPEWLSRDEERPSLAIAALFQTWLAKRRERQAPQAILSTWGEYRNPRLFDGNGIGMYLEKPPPEIEEAYRRLRFVVRGYRNLCRRHGVPVAVAVFPQRFQVQPRDWQATVETYGLVPGCFDLKAPNRFVGSLCRRLGIPCLDPTEALTARAAAGEVLYMPHGDMHWNREGNRAFAEAVRQDLAAALRPSRPD
ncbi:MAG TPA: hypothetical protein VMW27_01440 [Thermoanaerobaculia bacterium]|nr:hypothetical protein [Thermoanaerobaculia bacterium]